MVITKLTIKKIIFVISEKIFKRLQGHTGKYILNEKRVVKEEERNKTDRRHTKTKLKWKI